MEISKQDINMTMLPHVQTAHSQCRSTDFSDPKTPSKPTLKGASQISNFTPNRTLLPPMNDVPDPEQLYSHGTENASLKGRTPRSWNGKARRSEGIVEEKQIASNSP